MGLHKEAFLCCFCKERLYANISAHFYYGGLNFQATHHLFPAIAHTHYPALCEETIRKLVAPDEPPISSILARPNSATQRLP